MISNPKKITDTDRTRLHSLLLNSEPYLSCDDCFDLVDSAVEMLIEQGTAFSEQFQAHLRACGACKEEADALAELIG